MKEFGVRDIGGQPEYKKKVDAEKEHRQKTLDLNTQTRGIDQSSQNVADRSPCLDVLPDDGKPEALHDQAGGKYQEKETQADEIFRSIIQPGWAGNVPPDEGQYQSAQTKKSDEIQKKG